LSGPSKTEIRDFVLDRLKKSSANDEFAWYPVVGWMLKNGQPFGLGVELFGRSASKRQLEKLASPLVTLGHNGTIEVASFRKVEGTESVAGQPLGPWDQTWTMLVGGSSGGVDPTGTMYCARLKPLS
jgi:hypothetical protein